MTVTAITGFTDPVSLTVDTESRFPAGVTSGGFSPASINGSGSSTLTFNTTRERRSLCDLPHGHRHQRTLTHTTATTLLVNLAPPASLTATPGDGQVSLSWAASIGANGYHVKRSRTSGGPYVGIACPTGTSYVDTGLTNGTTYYHVVSASYTGGPDAGGESADSSQASAPPRIAYADCNVHADRHRHANGHPVRDAHADQHAHADPHAHPHAHPHADGDSHSDRDAHPDADAATPDRDATATAPPAPPLGPHSEAGGAKQAQADLDSVADSGHHPEWDLSANQRRVLPSDTNGDDHPRHDLSGPRPGQRHDLLLRRVRIQRQSRECEIQRVLRHREIGGF